MHRRRHREMGQGDQGRRHQAAADGRKRDCDGRHPIRCRLADRRRAIGRAVGGRAGGTVPAAWSTPASRCGASPCSSTRCIPMSSAARFIWQVDTGVKVSAAKYDFLETDEYRSSPVVAVYATRQPIRRHLADGDCPDDFPMLHELRAEGATDYVAFPLAFTDGTVHVATWTTRQPGGFTPQQFADLEAVIAPLTRVAEIRALRRTATNLLNTYVGRQAGERILCRQDPARLRRGNPRRRSGSPTCAASPRCRSGCRRRSWSICSTAISTARCRPILEHGGEVLKFMGDGLLAIFPLAEDGDDAAEVCRRALAARAQGQSADRRARQAAGRQRGRDPLRARAACRPGDVRQHRRRQPARLHLHRAGGQSRGAAGEGRGATRPDRSSRRRNSPPMCRGIHAARRMHRGGLFGAAGGVRLDRTASQ